jgi:signal transduction histidine kinase
MTMPETSKSDKSHDRFVPPEAREHLKAAGEEMRKSIEALFPPELADHRRAARKEALLAARSIIDAALVRMEEQAKKS